MGPARKPVVAGMFYPGTETGLKKELSELFHDIRDESNSIGVVSPHAGYIYSGATAARAIASLKSVKSFVILGPNHNSMGPKFALMRQGTWQTPLGNCKIDPKLADSIECGFLEEDARVHAMEHSIEVQLPFLQHRFGAKFGFVPISVINLDFTDEFLSRCRELGKAIAKTVKGKEIGIITSSDFSHYIPAGLAERIDRKAINSITKLDLKGFFSVLEKNNASVCGYGPIAVLMAAAKQLGLKGRLLEYTNSGKATGSLDSVVGYAAIAFEQRLR